MDNKKTNYNIKVLEDAYKNVRMGSYAIDWLIGKIQDQGLVELLRKQNKFYLDDAIQLENLAITLGHELKDIGPMLKASSYSSINMKTLLNKDTSHIAEMLIEGTTMGITTLIKEINSSENLNEKVLTISNNIVAYQEKFVESLKKFL